MKAARKSCSIPEIKERLKKLSFDSFRDDEILGYDSFRFKAFSEICVSESEYEATEEKQGLLRILIDELKDILDSLALGGEEAKGAPFHELLDRNSVAAKIAYKRALYMVRDEKFCEAAMSTAFAVDYIADADASFKDDPSGLAEPLRTMAMGLLEETLTAYMVPNKYVASDCASSCGYCQDPLSTVARYCTQALESIGSPDTIINEIWETAAAMLGAFLQSRGADLKEMRFPSHIPRQASASYKLMIYHQKADRNMIMRGIDHYVEELRLCRVNLFVSQYVEEQPIIPPDF